MNRIMMNVVSFLAAETNPVGDEGLNEILNKILGIVNDTLMPIIWIGLGLFLTIKGAMIGTQIVKAADEPQVRQEKIGSLKYLIIGIFIAFIVSFAATALVNYFKLQLGTPAP